MMYKRIGRDEIELGLVAKTKLRDSIFFLPYRKSADSTFVIDTSYHLNIKIYNDTSYYSKIRRGERIDFAYIPILDFSYLGHWENNSFYVDYDIDLTSCIIQEIVFPNLSHIGTIGIKDSVVFTQNVALKYCTFDLHGENLFFNKDFQVYDPIALGHDILPFYFVNTHFRKKLIFYPYINEADGFWMKKYIKTVSFNSRLEKVEFSHCTFDSLEFKTWLSNSDFIFENCTFNNYVSIEKFDTSSIIIFDNNTANKYFKFYHFDKYTHIVNTTFRDTLDLYYIDFRPYKGDGFSSVNFSDDATVILNPDNLSLGKLNFNFIAVQKVCIPFMVQRKAVDFLMIPMTKNPNPIPVGIKRFFVDELDESLFDRSQSFYISLQRDAQILYEKQPDVVNNLISKFQYLAIQYEKKYHKDQLRIHGLTAILKHGLPLFWLTWKEIMVHNGYHGEMNFFLFISTFVILFSCVYFLFFQVEIITYFDQTDFTPEFRRGKLKKYSLVNYFKCLWQSVVIFTNPRFSKKYFALSFSLFLLVCIEWILGLFSFVMFFVHIAANYPFIKALIGI